MLVGPFLVVVLINVSRHRVLRGKLLNLQLSGFEKIFFKYREDPTKWSKLWFKFIVKQFNSFSDFKSLASQHLSA